MDYEIEDKSSDQALKEFAQWVARCGKGSTGPNFLKFKEDMRELFNDTEMFNNTTTTINR
tara:strand:+ start:18128 stop:18307 length:180 start_codon:yes stop_codon:yes gene_type:complete